MRGHCSICDEAFSQSLNDVSAIFCGHTFHQHCLTSWTSKSQTCPQCRQPLDEKSVIKKLFFSADPDNVVEEDPLVLKAQINQLEATMAQKQQEVLIAQQTTEMQADIIAASDKQIRGYEASEQEKTAVINSLMSRLEQVTEEEKKTVNELTAQLKAEHQTQVESHQRLKVKQDELVSQVNWWSKFCADVEKQRDSLCSKLQHSELMVSEQARIIACYSKCVCGIDTSKANMTDSLCGSPTGDQEAAQDKPEPDQLHDDVLEELASTKKLVLSQSELINSLKECICGKDEPLAQEHPEMEGSDAARIKQLEYANRTLSSKLQKYKTNASLLMESSPEAHSNQKSQDKVQSSLQQLETCCKVLKSEILKTQELIENEQGHNTQKLEGLNYTEYKMEEKPPAMSEEANAMDIIRSTPLNVKRSAPLDVSDSEEDTCIRKRLRSSQNKTKAVD